MLNISGAIKRYMLDLKKKNEIDFFLLLHKLSAKKRPSHKKP